MSISKMARIMTLTSLTIRPIITSFGPRTLLTEKNWRSRVRNVIRFSARRVLATSKQSAQTEEGMNLRITAMMKSARVVTSRMFQKPDTYDESFLLRLLDSSSYICDSHQSQIKQTSVQLTKICLKNTNTSGPEVTLGSVQ